MGQSGKDSRGPIRMGPLNRKKDVKLFPFIKLYIKVVDTNTNPGSSFFLVVSLSPCCPLPPARLVLVSLVVPPSSFVW